ncbi:MAG: hypothetical protein ABSG69_04485 [Candidatus Acidiferrum sp.]|jgi:hypothetical protein
MATKKKTKKAAKKKPAKAAKKSSKKIAKKVAKKIVAKKVSAAKKPSKLVAKARAKTAPKPAARATDARKPVRSRGTQENIETVAFEPAGLGARSGGQSGDLQGLTNRAGADSESVDELLEEGNAFEAEVVKGVEDVPDADEGEIRTHEIPEDDVPGEYNDQ